MPKQATLSSKQLLAKNEAKLKVSSILCLSGPAVAWFLYFTFLTKTNNFFYLNIFGSLINLCCQRWLTSQVRSNIVDLETCETTHDLLITTSLCLILSCFSRYFWILWFWLPTYLFYKLWINYIWPWFTHVPEEQELTEKQKKKLEKKQKQKVKFRNF